MNKVEPSSIVGARPACDCSFDSRAGIAPTRNFPANGFFGLKQIRLVVTMSGRYHELLKKEIPMPVAIQPKSVRIDVRASNPVKLLLQEAARAAHKNVSEFLLEAGIVAANHTLADRLRFELTPDKWDAFQAALDRPTKPKPKLKKLLSEPGLLG